MRQVLRLRSQGVATAAEGGPLRGSLSTTVQAAQGPRTRGRHGLLVARSSLAHGATTISTTRGASVVLARCRPPCTTHYETARRPVVANGTRGMRSGFGGITCATLGAGACKGVGLGRRLATSEALRVSRGSSQRGPWPVLPAMAVLGRTPTTCHTALRGEVIGMALAPQGAASSRVPMQGGGT